MTKEIFDTALDRLRKRRIAGDYQNHRFLVERCAADLCERLEAVNKQFPVSVNLTSHQSVFSVQMPLPESALFAEADSVPSMLGGMAQHRLILDQEVVPFAVESVDLFISILSFHHLNDLPGTLIQLRRALRPDGLLLATMFGSQTLSELREALAQAEIDETGGMSPRVSPFVDVRDAGGLLQRAGYALPVVDSDIVTVTYRSLAGLMRDLRGMGQTNILSERSNRPLTRLMLSRCEQIYRDKHATENGKLKATFEVLYLTGWAPHESQQKPMRPGTAKARLADALRTKEEKI